jgi:hypothetical protein
MDYESGLYFLSPFVKKLGVVFFYSDEKDFEYHGFNIKEDYKYLKLEQLNCNFAKKRVSLKGEFHFYC